MNLFRNRESGALITLEEAKAAHHNVSFGAVLTKEDLDRLNIDPVLHTAQPMLPSRFHRIEEVSPTQGDDGNWYRAYKVVDSTVGSTPEQYHALKQTHLKLLLASVTNQLTLRLSAGYKFDLHNPDGSSHSYSIPMDPSSHAHWMAILGHAEYCSQSKLLSSQPLPLTIGETTVELSVSEVISTLSAARSWWFESISTANAMSAKLREAVNDPNISLATMEAMTAWPIASAPESVAEPMPPPAATPAPTSAPEPA